MVRCPGDHPRGLFRANTDHTRRHQPAVSPTDFGVQGEDRLDQDFYLGLPMIVGGNITGALVFIRFGGPQYTDDQMVILFSHAVVIGFTLIFLIRIFANYSGAHFNPIVSLLFFFKGELSSKDLIIYIVIQCVAATFGTMFANFLFGLNIKSDT